MITKKVIISPVYNSRKIVTRIEGIISQLNIPETAPGWYRFKPINNKEAKVIGPAEIDERQSYLKFLSKQRMILAFRKNNVYFGVPLKNNNLGLDISTLLPVYLHDDSALDFSKCVCRYDGANFWYDSMDPSGDLAKTDYLNQCLSNLLDPSKIVFKGLTVEEKIAYSIRFKVDERLVEELKTKKIRTDIEFGGGKFIKSVEKSDHYAVSYEIDGHKYNSIISKDPSHKVITAGICLSGGDSDFDLKSLISVIREGQNKSLIHRTLR